MNKEQKTQHVEELKSSVDKAKALIFAGYRGLKVSEITELRSKLRKGDSLMKVVKNRLMKRVLKEKGLDKLSEYFRDPTALATSDKDPVSVAKILVEFAKSHGNLTLKGGYLEGSVLTTKDIETLSKMPSREVLIARALSSMLAPATNVACALQAIPRKLVYALNAIKEKKQ